MKQAEWAKVKIGEWVIYASEYDGVFKAKVIDKDIRLYEPGSPSVWSYPYGLTKDTGTVKVQYDTTEAIMNLRDLIKYSLSVFMQLQKAWKDYQEAKAQSDFYEAALIEKIQGYL